MRARFHGRRLALSESDAIIEDPFWRPKVKPLPADAACELCGGPLRIIEVYEDPNEEELIPLLACANGCWPCECFEFHFKSQKSCPNASRPKLTAEAAPPGYRLH